MIYEIFNLLIGVSVISSIIVLLMGDSDNHPLQEKSMEFIFNTIAVVTGIVTISSLIAASTPTPKDDQMLGKVYKLIDWCAINVGKAKEK